MDRDFLKAITKENVKERRWGWAEIQELVSSSQFAPTASDLRRMAKIVAAEDAESVWRLAVSTMIMVNSQLGTALLSATPGIPNSVAEWFWDPFRDSE